MVTKAETRLKLEDPCEPRRVEMAEKATTEPPIQDAEPHIQDTEPLIQANEPPMQKMFQ